MFRPPRSIHHPNQPSPVFHAGLLSGFRVLRGGRLTLRGGFFGPDARNGSVTEVFKGTPGVTDMGDLYITSSPGVTDL